MGEMALMVMIATGFFLLTGLIANWCYWTLRQEISDDAKRIRDLHQRLMSER